MKAKSKKKSGAVDGKRQPKKRRAEDAEIARRARVTVTEVMTFRVLFPRAFERLKRAA